MGVVLLSQCDGDLDDITNGTTYGKVKITNISAGHILLAQCTGNLDDIANGTNYGKVALTSISAGKIVVAGLDSGVTDRMFSDLNTKNNIEAWRKSGAVTYIDGNKIYTGSITSNQIATNTITADKYNELRNTYVFNGDDSLDANHPFELDFEIVSEMTSINSVKLSFRISQFRAYSKGVASGGGQTTSSGGATTPTSSSGGGQTTSSGGGQTSSSENRDHTHPITIINSASGVEVRYYGNALVCTGGGSIPAIGNPTQNHTHTVSDHTHTVSNHTHTVSIPNHTHTVADHTHSLTFGIYEDSQSPTIHYHIDNGAGYGAASGNFTTDQLDIDITYYRKYIWNWIQKNKI